MQQFYIDEAEVLDESAPEWFEYSPTISTTGCLDKPTVRAVSRRSVHARGEVCFYDETKSSLEWRIRRFDSGAAWSEDPPSRTRHFVTNVAVRHVVVDDPSGFTTDDLVVLVQPARLSQQA